jgi:tRNA-2-methylthio-N6-dimethylallyladenosine synthase
VQWLRDAIPDMALSTDLIVGFPGESDADFDATLALVEKVRYQFLYGFIYSPRKHTAAIRFKDPVSEAVKTKRLAALNALQDRITLEINEATIGTTHKVLFLYPSRKKPDYFYGRNAQFQLVQVQSKAAIVGQELDVRITEANKTALVGTLA